MTDRPLTPGETEDERIVGVNQIFFSTTDLKGRITGANSVFVDIAKYSHAELLGSPHSIIRHAEMPGGVFKIMWDRLEAGKPIAAYVKNRAKDGLKYWVFATVTPTAEGYVSVRTRPVVQPLWDAAAELYDSVRPRELELRDGGMGRHEVAKHGEVMLAEGLQAAGIASYEEFMLTALPEEVATRERLAAQSAPIDVEAGSALGNLVGGAQFLEQQIVGLLGELGSLAELAQNIVTMTRRKEHAQRDLVAASQEAVAAVESLEGVPPAVLSSTSVIESWVLQAIERLAATTKSLSSLPDHIALARFEIAMTRLHNRMVLDFAAEVAQGVETTPAAEYLPILCISMADDVERTSEALSALVSLLTTAVNELEETQHALQQARTFLASWQMQVNRYGLTSLATVADTVSTAQLQMLDQVAELANLAHDCYVQAGAVDPVSILEGLPVVRDAADELAQEAAFQKPAIPRGGRTRR